MANPALSSYPPPHDSDIGPTPVLKLDEAGPPTDLARLNASISAHGLMPKLQDPGTVPMRVYYSGTAYESVTALVARFTAYTTIHAGLYRVGVYLVDKVHSVAGTVTTNVYYTDRYGAHGPIAINATALSAAGVASAGSPVTIYCTSGSIIEFATTIGAFSGTYDCYLEIEAV